MCFRVVDVPGERVLSVLADEMFPILGGHIRVRAHASVRHVQDVAVASGSFVKPLPLALARLVVPQIPHLERVVADVLRPNAQRLHQLLLPARLQH